MPLPAARRVLLLALAAGVVVDLVISGNAAGVNALVVTTLLVVAAAIVAGSDGARRMDPVDSWIPVAALVFAALPAVRADDWLVTTDILLAAALTLAFIACLSGARITRGLVPAVLEASVALIVAVVTGAASLLADLRRARHRDPVGRAPDVPRQVPGWLTALVPVGRGLLLGLPVLALFAVLFASADAVFAELARTALSWRVDLDLGAAVQRSIRVSLVAWAVAGLLALAAGLLPALLPARVRAPHDPDNDAPPSDGPPPPPWWTHRSLGAASVSELRQPVRLGSVEAATVLLLVDALFAGFVVLQLAYLFGGRDTLGVAGLTYAEYARRGFFELVTVAVLAGTLVVALDLVTASRGRVQLGASLVLLALTAIVLLSAFQRLRLYQDTYGWTELRFVVLVAIGWVAVALVATAWLLRARMTRWTLHVLGVMVLLAVAGMNVVGPQAFVADRNLERALDPAVVPPGGRTGLDGAYLAQLGDEAVPAVVDAYPSLPPSARVDVDRFLRERQAALAADPALQGWPAWNLTRERARGALAGWAAVAR